MPEKPLAVRIPRDSVNDENFKLCRWAATEGEYLESGQLVAEIETSKAVLEIRAPKSGYLRRCFSEGDDVPINRVLYYLSQGPKDPLPKKPTQTQKIESIEDSRFSQKARTLIKQHGLNPMDFKITGLVRERDVLDVLASRDKAAIKTPGVPSIKGEPLPQRKLTEIRYLSAGQNELTSSISLLCPTRGLRRIAQGKSEWGSSLTPVIVFETARLLRKYPALNAFYENGTANYYQEVNLGFAIDAGHGLKVLVIRSADNKTLKDIVREMQDLVLCYLNDKVDVAALSNGTFTVSDLSSQGAFGISPLINYKQSAILAIGAEFFPPNSETGIFQLTLTFDHRLTEGVAVSSFLRQLRERLNTYEASS